MRLRINLLFFLTTKSRNAAWRGAGIARLSSPNPSPTPAVIRNYWRLVERYRAAVVGAVPTVLAAVLNAPHDGVDLSSVRYASGGGSAIPVEVGKAIEAITGTRVLEVYGMTETSSVHTMSYAWREVRLGSVEIGRAHV